MTQAVSQILQAIQQLSLDERAELVDRLVEETPAEIEAAQMEEMRRRIAQVESGEVALIPGDEALARVRGLLSSFRYTA